MNRSKLKIVAIAVWPWMLAASWLSRGAEAPSPTAQSSPAPAGGDGKGVSVDVNTGGRQVEIRNAKPVTPPTPPGADSSANLSPAQQSQVGAGITFRFGQGAKPEPSPEKTDDPDEAE